MLGADDLDRLAVAAYLLGADDESVVAWERAHAVAVDEGDHERAARVACWLGIALLLRGEPARAGGWLARAERRIADTDANEQSPARRLAPRS